MIEETARQAGHLDLARELLDGMLPSLINSARVDSKNPRHANLAEQYRPGEGCR